jgi:hypothetical protein
LTVEEDEGKAKVGVVVSGNASLVQCAGSPQRVRERGTASDGRVV